jgi:hypothetical protein
MIRTFRFFAAAALVLAAPLAADAQRRSSATSSGAITASEIDGHLRFLSHDLLEGRAPATRGGELAEQYTAHRYHQPSDEHRADYDLSGAVQLAESVLGFGTLVANSVAPPTWNPDAEFRVLRPLTP